MTTNLKTPFADSLKGLAKTAYSTGYSFHVDCNPDSTEAEAHEAGLKEMARIADLREEARKPQTWVNLSTGKKFRAVI